MMYKTTSSTICNHDELAIVSIAIAIGSQCRGSTTNDQHYATKMFNQGQKYAFEGMLQDPSLSMIRIFLQMAFYMLGACRRNSAFMYIGVAARAASALGLHTVEKEQHPLNDDFLKRLVLDWMPCLGSSAQSC